MEALVPAVLIVDDNADFLDVIRDVLEEGLPGFRVSTVDTGQKAITFLRRHPPFADAPRPDFVVMDYNLDGFVKAPAVLEQLADDAALRAIPVLVISVTAWEADEAAARAAGARDYREKPYRVRPLYDTILDFWRAHVEPKYAASAAGIS
jgi:CheY-like chemotaxis protein